MSYKDFSGVYYIKNTKNGMIYIGSSAQVRYRIYNHKWHLNRDDHINRFLQDDWNRHGEKFFVFEVLEERNFDSENERLDLENYYIDEFNTMHPNGYNLLDAYGANSCDETKKLRSEERSGEKSPMFGKHSRGMLGMHHTEEAKKKVSKSLLGNTRSLGIKSKDNTSSKYVGVTYIKWYGKWQSRISYKKKRIHIGYFDTEIDAALAYNNKAVELFGGNAVLNKIEN